MGKWDSSCVASEFYYDGRYFASMNDMDVMADNWFCLGAIEEAEVVKHKGF